MNLIPPLSLTDRFVSPLRGLYAAVAGRFRSGVMTVAMIRLVCGRIRRVELRVAALLALFLAGALPPEREVGRGARARTRERATGGAVPRIPRGFAWLIRMVPCEAANYAGQLRAALAAPEMAGLLAASPKARRALAPLCRMLAIEKEILTPAVAVAVAVASAPLAGDGASPVRHAEDRDGGRLPEGGLSPVGRPAWRSG